MRKTHTSTICVFVSLARIRDRQTAFLLYIRYNSYAMPKKHEFTNISTNNSSALVAPQRSEIRISFSVELPALRPSTRKMLHRAAMILTPVLCAALAVCYWLGANLPSWMVGVMVIAASVGFVYGFVYITAVADLFEREQKKGGKHESY